ncbi:TPM domain-containing protein [Planctopirus hydrillae]|uniref:TPM domain-containing protein n=1 Tax=Planctopirus hydrillae TaxID=1841610 RepID=A0A1C3EGY7_9PLAN|nr:TPM domain-containing protein [Planctopirus hydrillae]ODA32501.1 hypothetical protein A6X21_19185 [Planctopirus hydrillae]
MLRTTKLPFPSPLFLVLVTSVVLSNFTALPGTAFAQHLISMMRPAEGQFIVDRASLLKQADYETVERLADNLLKSRAAPLIVVTISTMAEVGGEGMSIDMFARTLFDQWGIGPKTVANENWNRGMLLVVAHDDRKARIELGAGWGRSHDKDAQQIMDELMLPHFRQGDYSSGILAGVEGLDAMARDLKLPSKSITSRPIKASDLWIAGGVIGLAIFSVVSLVRRGTNGWAWIFWGFVFTVVVMVMFKSRSSRRSGYSGGSYGGSSFGGGFSGGGGASGSW